MSEKADARGAKYVPNTEPISRPEEDRLGRREYARKIVDALAAWDLAATGLVVGIEGSWGEGKSSLVSMMRADLMQQRFLVRDFNPWLLSDGAAITAEFFRLLMRLVGDLRWNEDQRSKARKLLQSYAPGVLGIAMDAALPGVVAKVLSRAGNALLSEFLKTPDLLTQRQELSELLESAPQRIAVIVEDVDRVTPDEAIRIATLIRLVAGFPNVLYVLPYERRHLARLLSLGMSDSGDTTMGEGLLQRLVQLDISLPKASDAEMGDLLSKELERAATAAGLDVASERVADALRGFSQMHLLGAKRLFPTPRAITRYAASAALTMRAVGDLVHLGDLLAVELVRVSAPTAYETLRRDPQRFVGGGTLLEQFQRTGEQLVGPRDDKAALLMEELLEGVEEPVRSTLPMVLRQLMPTLGEPATDRQSRLELRFRAPEFTERYFRLGIPPNDVDDGVLAQALDAAATGEQLALLGILGDERTGQAATYRIADVALAGSTEARAKLKRALEVVAPELSPEYATGPELSSWQRLALVYGQLLLLADELSEEALRASADPLPDEYVAYGLRVIDAPANRPEPTPGPERLASLRRYGIERLERVLDSQHTWQATSPLGMYVAVLAAWDTETAKRTVARLIDRDPANASILLKARVSKAFMTNATVVDLSQLQKEIDPEQLLVAAEKDANHDPNLVRVLRDAIRENRERQASATDASGRASTRLSQLLRTSAGVSLGELAQAGTALVPLVKEAFEKALSERALPDGVEYHVQLSSGGVTYTVPGYQQVQLGQDGKVYVSLQSSVPSAGTSADLSLFIGNPNQDEPLLLVFEKENQRLPIRAEEVVPTIGPSLRSRLREWASDCVDILVKQLEDQVAATLKRNDV